MERNKRPDLEKVNDKCVNAERISWNNKSPLTPETWEILRNMSLQILSSELSNLIQESKRKHSELRTVGLLEYPPASRAIEKNRGYAEELLTGERLQNTLWKT